VQEGDEKVCWRCLNFFIFKTDRPTQIVVARRSWIGIFLAHLSGFASEWPAKLIFYLSHYFS
jgi:hypothetical protein